jgi:hypothetical protein
MFYYLLKGTVKVGNFDHFSTFQSILKLFPNTFLPLFYIEITVYYGTSAILTLTLGFDCRSTIFFKKCWVVDLSLDQSTSTTKQILFLNRPLGLSMVRSTSFHVIKKKSKTPEPAGAQKSALQTHPTVIITSSNCSVNIFCTKKSLKVIFKCFFGQS